MVTRDVEFRLRAIDQTKTTIAGATAEVNKLTSAISEQVKMAAKGEVSTSELAESIKALGKAGDQIAKSRALVLSFRQQEERLDALQAKLELARAKEQAFRDSLVGVETVTKTQANQLTRLETATIKANSAVNKGSADLAEMSRELKAIGVDLRDFDQSELKLINTYRSSASGIATLQSALENYQRTLRATRAAAAEGIDPTIASPAEAASIRAKAEAAQKLAQGAEYVRFWTDALNEMDATEKRVSAFHGLQEKEERDVAALRAQSSAAQKLSEDAEYVRFWTNALEEMSATEKRVAADRSLENKAQEELTAFRMLAEGARMVQGGYTVLDSSTRSLQASSSSLARELQAIADPAKAVGSTLAGVEVQAEQLAEKIKTLKGVTADYAGTARQVADAQRSAVGQAGLIDQYRQQQAAVQAAQAALAAGRVELDEYIRLVRNAAAPSKELAAALSQAQSSVANLTAEAQRQTSVLGGLETGLERAGLDVRNLAADEERLRKTTIALAASQTKLGSVTSGRGAKGVQGILGLKPYELQNLGFQINDVFTQLASGTSITQTLAQQGGQILQIFPGAFSAMIAYIPALTLLGGTLGALALGVARLNQNAAALRQFTTALTLNADGARYNAQTLADAQRTISNFGVSFEDAGKAVNKFVNAGLQQDKIIAFGKAAKDASKVLGGEFTDSADQITQAFTRGYDAIADYDNKLNFLTASERERIKALFDSGKAEDARKQAFKDFTDKMEDAAGKADGPWATAWAKLGKAVDTLLDSLSKTWIVKAFSDSLQGLAEIASDTADGITNKFANLSPLESLDKQIGDITKRISDLNNTTARNDFLGAQQGVTKPLALGQVTAEDTPTGGIPDRPSQSASTDTAATLVDLNRQLLVLQKQRADLSDREKNSTGAIAKSVADSVVGLGQEVIVSHQKQKLDHDILDTLADQLGARSKATKAQQVQAAGDKAYQAALAKGASDQAALEARRMAETAKRSDVEAQEATAAKAAAAAATAEQNRQEAAAKRLVNLQQELIRGRQAFQGKQDALGIADLDTRLQAVDEKFDALIAKAREFQKQGGSQIGGQSVDEFVAGANTARGTTKQLETLKFDEDSANAKIKERNDLVQTYTNLVQAGAMTTTEAQAKIKAAYEDTAPAISASIQAATDLVTSLKDQGLITLSVYDQVIAKLQEIGTQIKYTDPDVQKLKETFNEAFSQGTLDIVKDIGKNIADMAVGAESVSDGFKDIGVTIINVAAQFIEAIASMILKLYALKLAEEITGIDASAVGGGGGGSGGDLVSKGLDFITSLFHGGGQGRSPSMTRSGVSAAAFVGAPRFHSGRMGLQGKEMAAIINNDESVLTPDQMRDAFRPSQGGPSEINLRSVLLDDPNRLTDYLASPSGEQTVVAIMNKNVPTLRSKLRLK